MQKDYQFKSFEDEIDDRVTGRMFYKFVALFFIFYLIVMIGGTAFYSRFEYVSVSGVSMQNTINPGVDLYEDNEDEKVHDGVIIRLSRKDVDYGDIVILDRPDSMSLPDSLSKSIIKRVLAFEGDYVSVAKVNNSFHLLRVKKNTNRVEVLNEKYIKSYAEWNQSRGSVTYNGVMYEKAFYDNYFGKYQSKAFTVNGVEEEVYFFQVPEDNIFFMGDNRAHSSDAREVGTYAINQIEGRVVEIIKDGSPNRTPWWWLNRTLGYLRVCWSEILAFFGARG